MHLITYLCILLLQKLNDIHLPELAFVLIWQKLTCIPYAPFNPFSLMLSVYYVSTNHGDSNRFTKDSCEVAWSNGSISTWGFVTSRV